MPALDPLLPWFILLPMWLGAVIYTINSYRSEPRSGEIRSKLIALRIASLTLLLVIALRPQLETVRQLTVKDRFYIIKDNSVSMSFKDMPQGKTRAAFCEKMLSDNRDELKTLAAKVDLKNWDFARTLRKNPEDKLNRSSSALGTALFDCARDARSHKAGGILLISDGVNNDGLSLNRAVSELRRRDIPVHTLTLGQNSYSGNIVDGVSEILDCPSVARRKKLLPVTARIIIRGQRNTKVPVRFLIDNDDNHSLSVQPMSSEQSFTLHEEIDISRYQPGYHKLSMIIDTGKGEISPVNNRIDTWFRISNDGLKVLVLTTSPSPDSKFLRRALDSTEGIDPEFPSPFLCRTPDGRQQLLKLPYEKYEVIVFADCNFKLLPGEIIQRIANNARKRRQGLLFTGEFASLTLDKDSPMKEYLPVSVTQKFVSKEIKPLPNPEAEHFVTAYMSDYLKSGNTLPPYEGRLTSANHSPGASRLLIAGKAPLLCCESYGTFRTAWFNGSGLWQWVLNDSGRRLYGKLWKRLIYYLASRENDLAANLALHCGRTRFLTSEKIHLTADLLDGRGLPISDSDIKLEISLKNKAVKNLSFTPDRDNYRLECELDETGLYSLSAKTRLDGKEIKSNDIQIYVREPRIEFERALADSDLMSKLAEATGGEQLTPGELNGFLKNTANQARLRSSKTVTAVKSIWDNLYLYLLFALILSSEWFWRRRRGLL